jgi:hypothetical protein
MIKELQSSATLFAGAARCGPASKEASLCDRKRERSYAQIVFRNDFNRIDDRVDDPDHTGAGRSMVLQN